MSCLARFSIYKPFAMKTKDEIVEALVLARFVKASSVFSSATEAMCMLVNKDQ